MDNILLNQRVVNAKPSPIRAFNDRISGIDGLLKLTLGEPDFKAPDAVHKAAIEAIEKGHDGYTHSRGMIELRQAIAGYLDRRNGLKYDPETEIIASHGGTGALFSTLFALLNEGDKVVVPSPHYAVYQTILSLCGATYVPVDVSADGFILTGDRLEEVIAEEGEIKLVLMNHPSNPTGVTYTEDQLSDLAGVLRKHGILAVSDEIYSELTYGRKHISMGEVLRDQTIVLNGASKSHAMTGWRMGIIAGPEEYISQIFKVQQASINTPNTAAQYGAIAAYADCDEAVDEMKAVYDKRRSYIRDAMREIGFETADPTGAFYLFVKVPDWFDGSDEDFCVSLAEEAKVGVIPGSAFGEAGSGFFRISYAASTEDLEEFVRRVKAFWQAKAK